MSFQDHFSGHAADYERWRPRYPPALFAFLAEVVPVHRCALDVATGNGQAALGLAGHFERVVATDLSAPQLARATPHPRIEYRVEPAECVAVPDATFDLAAAAQAAHWFDLARFYPEMRRVLRPGGVLALWTYEKFRGGGSLDAALDDFYRNVVGHCWPRERRHVETGYRSLPFPFAPVAAPSFELVTRWSLDVAVAYVGTWSAVQRYRSLHGRDPLPLLHGLLAPLWGPGERELHWPIHLLLGRV
jgi:SAM-dependent methyltransferase